MLFAFSGNAVTVFTNSDNSLSGLNKSSFKLFPQCRKLISIEATPFFSSEVFFFFSPKWPFTHYLTPRNDLREVALHFGPKFFTFFPAVMRTRLRGTYRVICASDWLGGLSGCTRIGWIGFYSGCCSSYFLDLRPLPLWSVWEHRTAKLSACCRLSVFSSWNSFLLAY